VVERIFNFSSRIGQNSRCPEYYFGQQLSQIPDGPSNGSKQLDICELRQLETRPVAESTFLADHTFLYKTGFWQKICHVLPRNFVYEKRCQRTQISTGYSYDLYRHTVWSLWCFEDLFQFLTGYGQIGLQHLVRFLGHKMGQTR
jgi:hypothetical protein